MKCKSQIFGIHGPPLGTLCTVLDFVTCNYTTGIHIGTLGLIIPSLILCCAALVTNLACHPPISTLTTVFAINFGPCPFIIVTEPSFSSSLPRFQKHFSAVVICFSSTSVPMLISKSRTRSRHLPTVHKNIIFLAFWQHLSPCHGASCFLLPLMICAVILQ